jgi:hypothetical protein
MIIHLVYHEIFPSIFPTKQRHVQIESFGCSSLQRIAPKLFHKSTRREMQLKVMMTEAVQISEAMLKNNLWDPNVIYTPY